MPFIFYYFSLMELFSVSTNNTKVITRRKNRTQKMCLEYCGPMGFYFFVFVFFLSEKFSCK